MNENVILLSDHIWYAVMDKEQAQKFVNQHEYTHPAHCGIYIDKKGYRTILWKEGDEEE